MTLELEGTKPTKPFILARNWDRFGGRLSEILNGYYLARRFDLEFKFTWPDEKRFPEMKEMLGVFSPIFLRSHLMSENQLEEIQILQLRINGNISKNDFLKHFLETREVAAVTISDFFKVPMFHGENSIQVLNFFKEISSEIWSDEVKKMRKEVSSMYTDKNVLHARYGDLVTGNWNNFVDPSKYVTFEQIRDFLEISATRGKTVILISDTKEVQSAFPGINDELANVISSKLRLCDENQETLVDLFKMEFSAGVYAPAASAYSTIGARLSGRTVHPLPIRRHSDGKSLREIEKVNSAWDLVPDSLRGRLVSRDFDQEINRLDGVFSIRIFDRITRFAHEADPNNAFSLNHIALAKSLRGDQKLSEKFLDRSREISIKSLQTHQDPLFAYSLAAFLCHSIEILRRQRLLLGRGKVLSELNALIKLQSDLRATHPFQIDKGLIEDNVEVIIKVFKEATNSRDKIRQALNAQKIFLKITKSNLTFLDNSLFLVNFLVSLRFELEMLQKNI